MSSVVLHDRMHLHWLSALPTNCLAQTQRGGCLQHTSRSCCEKIPAAITSGGRDQNHSNVSLTYYSGSQTHCCAHATWCLSERPPAASGAHQDANRQHRIQSGNCRGWFRVSSRERPAQKLEAAAGDAKCVAAWHAVKSSIVNTAFYQSKK